MKNIIIFSICLVLVLLGSCTSQRVQPQAPVYNITYTDNSQTLTGDNIKAKATSKTESRADIKPLIQASAESTTKSGMWIFWLVIVVVVCLVGYFIWLKFKKT